MTEQKERKFCRYQNCRMKLPEPTTNLKEAFCTPGCKASFYRTRCIACEEPMERRSPSQKMCKACREAIQARPAAVRRRLAAVTASAQNPRARNAHLSRVEMAPVEAMSDRALAIQAEIIDPHRWQEVISPDGVETQVTAVKFGKQPKIIDRFGYTLCMTCGKRYECNRNKRHNPRFCCYACQERFDFGSVEKRWRQIAGPTLTANQFRAAPIPDGPTGDWAGGEYERIEEENRKLFEKHLAKLADKAPAPVAPAMVIDAKRVAALVANIPDDLSIPPFLDRRPPPALKEAA